MLHSSIQENWLRLEIMHGIAESYYQLTQNTDFRKRMLEKGELFPFYSIDFENIQKESSIVGMIKVWSVVTLESMINYVLVDNLRNAQKSRESIIKAIENPRAFCKGKQPDKASELALKMLILSEGDCVEELIELATSISYVRNCIVHDKPFEMDEEGNISYFTKKNTTDKISRYGDLKIFFEDCEKLKIYFTGLANEPDVFGELSFSSFIRD